MSELMRELEEDLREERMNDLWKHTARVLIAVSVVIIIATMIYEALAYHHRSVAMERTDIFLAGVAEIKSGDYKGAVTMLGKLTADDTSSY